MMKQGLDAIKLQWLLFATIVVILAATGASIYFLSGVLHAKWVETDHAKIDAELIESDLSRLRSLEAELNANADTVTRAKQIVGDTREYQYQNQIIEDINDYARQTDVVILGIDFPPIGEEGTASTEAGLNYISANISLQTPVSYTNFMRFLKLIEQNLTKMQVTSIAMSPSEDNRALIDNPSIGLEVYVREES